LPGYPDPLYFTLFSIALKAFLVVVI